MPGYFSSHMYAETQSHLPWYLLWVCTCCCHHHKGAARAEAATCCCQGAGSDLMCNPQRVYVSASCLS